LLIVGGPGAGKTTLALALAERTGLPLHHLDDIAREAGARGPERSASDREHDIADIASSPRWIAEGVHLRWTAPLFEAADAIVWLDHVSAQRSSGRILRRFVRQAMAEARRRRGRERFLRLRDYGRRLRELIVSVPETRTYPRSELAVELERHSAKVLVCRTERDVAAALEQLSRPATSIGPPDHGR
jgi:adenylate kinase family enzyme